MPPIASNTIRRYDFGEVGVALLEKCVTVRVGLRSYILKLQPVSQTPSALCRSRCRTLSSFSNIMSACTPQCLVIIIMY